MEDLFLELHQKIKTYIEQVPDKASTFNIITLQQATYKIECWYIEIVKNPYYSGVIDNDD